MLNDEFFCFGGEREYTIGGIDRQAGICIIWNVIVVSALYHHVLLTHVVNLIVHLVLRFLVLVLGSLCSYDSFDHMISSFLSSLRLCSSLFL